MYKCAECGHVFDEPYLYQEPHGETTECCPKCMGGGFQAARQCGRCGSWHLEEDLFGGVCRDCLVESITPEAAEQYAFDRKVATDFSAAYLGSDLRYCGTEMYRVIQSAYRVGKGRAAFARRWVAEDDIALEDYAAWLRERRENHVETIQRACAG